MFIYKTTNIINGKFYVGQSLYDDPKYLGGGNLIKKAIKKYGKENFHKEIIDICFSRDQLNEREVYWIEKLDSRNPSVGYNMAKGGPAFHITEDSKKKISNTLKGKYTGENSYRYGIKLTDQHKNCISESNKGKKISDETRKKISESNLGKVLSLETRKKLSEKHKGKSLSDNHKKNIGNGLLGRKHNENTLNLLRTNNRNKHQKNSLYVWAKNKESGLEIVFNNCCQAARYFSCTRQKIKKNQVPDWEIKTQKYS